MVSIVLEILIDSKVGYVYHMDYDNISHAGDAEEGKGDQGKMVQQDLIGSVNT